MTLKDWIKNDDVLHELEQLLKKEKVEIGNMQDLKNRVKPKGF